MKTKIEQIQFKQKTAAQILGVSPRALQNYTKRGLISKNAAGFYSKEALHKFANSYANANAKTK